MSKTILILLSIIAVCVLIVVILGFVINSQRKKYTKLKEQYEEIENKCEKISNEKDQLKEDLENEHKKKMELAKKLSDVSCMPIDDVLHQLQND